MDAFATDILIVFKREGLNGWEFLFRWAHVLAGITWIGLLYYFNFVQVPAFAELDAGARNQAVDKLASRALWWFRWAAMATLAFGILILGVQKEFGSDGGSQLTNGDYWKTAPGVAISTGILLAVTMFANVWLVIWPNQKKVIANARNVLAGGEADPEAAAAGRRAALASRQNTIFSFTMLWFMVGDRALRRELRHDGQFQPVDLLDHHAHHLARPGARLSRRDRRHQSAGDELDLRGPQARHRHRPGARGRLVRALGDPLV